MTSVTTIEWTDRTWNAVTGCTKVSPGCKNCYAETMATRLRAMGTPGYENGFALTLQPARLGDPEKRRQPSMYFANSMSDLFHEGVPDEYIGRVFDVIEATPRHTYQILTKRAERMADYCRGRPPPPNAWMGVSVEDRRYGLPRVEHLRSVAARVRFLSMEPLLEDVGPIDLAGIHQVIVGGESGRNARRMYEAWVWAIHGQCEAQEVAFFFKQWGAWGPDGVRRSKRTNGRLLGGRTWDGMPSLAGGGAVAVGASGGAYA